MKARKIAWKIACLCTVALMLVAFNSAKSQDIRSTTNVMTLPNEATTGTTAGCLARIVAGGAGGQGQLIKATTSDTNVDLYVVTLSAGTTGNAVFVLVGDTTLVMDNAVSITTGQPTYYIVASTTTPCYGHAQASPPANGMVVGKLAQSTTSIGQPARITALNQAYIPGSGAGTGTVTSVGLIMPAIFTVSGSPVTVNGNLTAALATQNANLAWLGPASGGAAAPTFRGIVPADISTALATFSAGGDTGNTLLAPTVLKASQNFALTGILTPTALSGNLHDYNPSGLSTTTELRLDPGAADRDFTGLAGCDTEGRLMTLVNIGTKALALRDASSSSSAGNRFRLGSDATIQGGQVLTLKCRLTPVGSPGWQPVVSALLDSDRVVSCVIPFGSTSASAPPLLADDDDLAQCDNDTGRDWKILSVAVWVNLGATTFTPILTGGASTSLVTATCTTAAGVWTACAVNGTPIVHSFSGTGATCGTPPCSIDGNIQSADGITTAAKIKIKALKQ